MSVKSVLSGWHAIPHFFSRVATLMRMGMMLFVVFFTFSCEQNDRERQFSTDNIAEPIDIAHLSSNNSNEGEILFREALMQETRLRKIILTASLIIVFLLVLLSASLFYAYIHRTKSNRILRNLSRLRTNFFTNITHEFRTPLTVILGLSKHLQEQKNFTQTESNYYLKAIDRQGTHLLALVNQLLNIAKINAGMDNPEWRRGNIVIYVRMVVDSFRLYAQNNNIKLSFSSNEPVIEMDFVPHYIDDILQNLLSNSLKFSPQNSKISVSASLIKNREIALKVTDTGEGIPEEEIKRVFDLFIRKNHLTRKAEVALD